MPVVEALPGTVLVADDDDVLRGQLCRSLTRRGWTAMPAPGVAEAMELARTHHPTHAVVDLRLGQENGLQLVRELLALNPAMVVVVFTGYGSIATAVSAMRLGAHHYLTKPADVDEILAAFSRPSQAVGDVELEWPAPAAAPSPARAEWEHINRVLEEHGGNISAAARAMGMHRRSLQRKLSKRPVPR